MFSRRFAAGVATGVTQTSPRRIAGERRPGRATRAGFVKAGKPAGVSSPSVAWLRAMGGGVAKLRHPQAQTGSQYRRGPTGRLRHPEGSGAGLGAQRSPRRAAPPPTPPYPYLALGLHRRPPLYSATDRRPHAEITGGTLTPFDWRDRPGSAIRDAVPALLAEALTPPADGRGGGHRRRTPARQPAILEGLPST
jgi:hypothetical protein